MQAFASGDVRLTATATATATAGDLAIGGEVATDSGDLELTTGRSIRQAEGRLRRTRNDNQGTLALRSGQAIGTADASILTDVAVLAAEAAGGGVFVTQVDGIQGNLAIGTTTGANSLTGIRAHNGDIEVTTEGLGVAQDYGWFDILGPVHVEGTGDIRLRTTGSQSGIFNRQYHRYG